MDIPIFWASNEHFFVEVEFVNTKVLPEWIDMFDVLGISIGVTKGEIYLLILSTKLEIKDTLELWLFSHN